MTAPVTGQAAFHHRAASGAVAPVRVPGYLQPDSKALMPVVDDDGFSPWATNTLARGLYASRKPALCHPQAASAP